MMPLTGVEVGVAKVGWDLFSKIWDALTKSRKSAELERLKSAAWREMLKGSAATSRSSSPRSQKPDPREIRRRTG
jgi:hypothetical protein